MKRFDGERPSALWDRLPYGGRLQSKNQENEKESEEMKGMKKLRRLLGLLMAMVMVIGTCFTASAATITIDDGDVTGAAYNAYKLMDVTTAKTTDDEGNEVDTYSYTVNNKYSSILQSVTSQTSDAAVITYLQSLTSRSNTLNTIAKNIYAAIKTANLSADATTTTGSLTNVDKGYYLIVETAIGTLPSGTTDTISIYMLDTAGSETTTVQTKESVPSLIKKVKEENDSVYNSTSTWQDGADYDIGDEVPFQLTGTISNQYNDYDTYYYAFHDKLSDGLDFTASSVKVYVENGTTRTELDSSEYTVKTDNLTDGCSFEVIIADLKSITNATVSSSSLIVVEYTAKLSSNAEIGSVGNPNEARLEYSNNPYGDGTGYTPWDKVLTFTYQLEVDKYSSNGSTLNGAGFTLYKYYASDANSGTWVAVGQEQVYTDGYVFTWEGLDEGYYKLEETTVPAGYTKASDITFTITSSYETNDDDPAFIDLEIKINSGKDSVSGTPSATESTGKVLINVINTTGSELPTTGGIGTTIFYALGGIMAVGAVILLITKKRMGSSN
ncbi:MAG: isopeptide-forming domain-containing fimbrial protein [Clostridiales bacterium]|nr:isopeptide-forming domain-containing fimbrial protein [Clostridiales bacterium]